MAYLDETGLKGLLGTIKSRLAGKVDKSQGAEKAGQVLSVDEDGQVLAQGLEAVLPGTLISVTACRDTGMTAEGDLQAEGLYAACLQAQGWRSPLCICRPAGSGLCFSFRVLCGSGLLEADLMIVRQTGAVTSQVHRDGQASAFSGISGEGEVSLMLWRAA